MWNKPLRNFGAIGVAALLMAAVSDDVADLVKPPNEHVAEVVGAGFRRAAAQPHRADEDACLCAERRAVARAVAEALWRCRAGALSCLANFRQSSY